LIPKSSQLWRERLAFRDALREDPELANEYAKLKLRLAELFQFDREAYTDAKGPFVARALAVTNFRPGEPGLAAPWMADSIT
jgi:GrpB-like predicted nucleotidyltransferase (UPF0157 family)